MTKTTNYNLNQWGAADKIKRADFNADNATIDAALKTIASAASATGNCALYYTSYSGTNTTDVVSATVPKGKPMVLFIANTNGRAYLIAMRGASYASVKSSSVDVNITWGDNSVKWRASGSSTEYNYSTTTYHVIVLSLVT